MRESGLGTQETFLLVVDNRAELTAFRLACSVAQLRDADCIHGDAKCLLQLTLSLHIAKVEVEEHGVSYQ